MSDRGGAEADGRGGRMTDQSIVINQGGFLLFLGAITLALVYVVWPFAAPVLWATLAAIMFQPLYRWFLVRLGNGPNRAAIASLLVITLSVLVPGFIIGGMIVDEAAGIVLAFQSGDIDISAWFAQIYGALPASARMALSQSGFGDFAELQARLQECLSESAGPIAHQTGTEARGGGEECVRKGK